MSEKPAWLPEMVCVDGEFHAIVAVLYGIFRDSFVTRSVRLRNMPVWYDRRVQPGETYEEGFWHLVTRDYVVTQERLFDTERGRRLPWCAPMLEHSDEMDVKYWVCVEDAQRVHYVWLENLDYVAILEERTLRSRVVDGVAKPARTIVFLKTAYHLDGAAMRSSFRRKFDRRV